MNASQTPRPFLKSVAEAYTAVDGDLSDHLFVFPNKRAGKFFLNYLAACSPRRVIAPEVMSVAEFAQTLSGLDEAPQLDLVFRLYRLYSEMKRGCGDGEEGDLVDFDWFVPWAEIMLSDFSEVDQYDVDAKMLFRNVSNIHDLSSNYLTDEQIATIERYFGYSPQQKDVKSFWSTIGGEADQSELKKSFLSLWGRLHDLYEALNTELLKENLATRGGMFRRAVAELDEERLRRRWKRVVAVGFNALSTTENEIFETLGKMRDADGRAYCEFFWDATGPVLSDRSMSPGREMAINMRNFPEPRWAREYMAASDTREMPASISVMASPSNSAQAKIAGLRVGELLEQTGVEKMEAAEVAVVLPDEGLLLPLLYSLPDGLKDVNLTMGYSMRFTSVASFMHHLREAQSDIRSMRGETGYYHEKISALLSHPLVHVAIGSAKASEINGYINKNHRYVVTMEEIREHSVPLYDLLYTGMAPGSESAQGVIDYLERVLATVDEALKRADDSVVGGDGGEVKSNIERSQIQRYRRALTQLRNTVGKFGFEMRARTVFKLVDRLLAMEKVSFKGEPLRGLQIMGMLETRAIDFRHLVVLSLNDSILPQRSRKRTFIPDALRSGYGLPSSLSSEALYSYYFYRMISRASDVTLIYDSREGEGMRSGGKSRFLAQLELLYAKDRIRKVEYGFNLSVEEHKPQPVEKDAEVMRELAKFRDPESRRNLSASALREYIKCPVRFYYTTVVGIKDDPEPSEYIDVITQGNIFHRTMEHLYVPREADRNRYLRSRILLDAKFLRGILEGKEGGESRIKAEVRRAVNREHFHLPDEKLGRPLDGAAAMVARRIERQVERVVRYDLSQAPRLLIGCEVKGRLSYPVDDGRFSVNMSYAFDRVDEAPGAHEGLAGGNEVRIIDYKTGSVDLRAADMEAVFGDVEEWSVYKKCENIFQLFLYAGLLKRRMAEEGEGMPGKVKTSIYDVNAIYSGGKESLPEMKLGGNFAAVTDSADPELADAFEERLDGMLQEIFDPATPFAPARLPEACQYCKLASVCGRE